MGLKFSLCLTTPPNFPEHMERAIGTLWLSNPNWGHERCPLSFKSYQSQDPCAL